MQIVQKPFVSIVIPVYNGSNYLREAIDSALNQTYEKCEVIVVNDGSTDDGATDAIARSYGNRIRYFKKDNGGVATAVNLGIKNMRGEYFAWLSHDDMFLPDKIEKQVLRIIEEGANNAIVHGNLEYLYVESGKKVKINWESEYCKELLESGAFAPVFLCIQGSTVLIHRSHFERVGMYDESLMTTQDSEFLFRAMRGQKSIFVEDTLVISRIHNQQGQRTIECHRDEFNEMFMRFCEELNDREKIEMCGSVRNFYFRLYCFLKYSRQADKIVEYLKNKFNDTQVNRVTEGLDEVKNRLNGSLYIFGAGHYGKEMYETLNAFDISVEGFIDNYSDNWGKEILGKHCYKLSDLNNSVKVIVAMADPLEVVRQCQQYGMTKIFTSGEVKQMCWKNEPSLINFL